MALDYFDIGGRIGQAVGNSEKKKKSKTSKRSSGPSIGRLSGERRRTQPTPQSPSANTGGGDAAKADAERKRQEEESRRLGAEAARKYATSGSESLGPGQYRSYVPTEAKKPLVNPEDPARRVPAEKLSDEQLLSEIMCSPLTRG